MYTKEQVLERAIRIVRKGWTQGYMARDVNGYPTEPLHANAHTWCLAGALAKAGGAADYKTDDQHRSILNQLRAMTGEDYVSMWNDREFRTQADVIELLKKAKEEFRDVS